MDVPNGTLIKITMLKQTVVFSALVYVALAAVAIAPLETKPEKYEDVEGCYISELDTVIPFGESIPSERSCMEYQCEEYMVQMVTCGAVRASPPCYLVQHKSLPYPDCCTQIICD